VMVCSCFSLTAVYGLCDRVDAADWRGKLLHLLQHEKRLIFNLCVSMFDFATDLIFAVSLMGIPWQSLYFFLSVAFLGLHALVAAAIIISAVFYLRSGNHSSDINVTEVMRRPLLFGAVLLMSLTNLELTVGLPWRYVGRDRSFDGFPKKWIMLAAFAAALLEDIPQFAIQMWYAIEEGISRIGVVSMGFSIVSLLLRGVVRLILLAKPGSVHVEIPEPTPLLGNGHDHSSENYRAP